MLFSNLTEIIFRIGLDPVFPPPNTWTKKYLYYIPENPAKTNKFELIFESL